MCEGFSCALLVLDCQKCDNPDFYITLVMLNKWVEKSAAIISDKGIFGRSERQLKVMVYLSIL